MPASPSQEGNNPRHQPNPSLTSAPSWSIPEIRVTQDDAGRMRIDVSDEETYGSYAARQFLAAAQGASSLQEGMNKRPSRSDIQILHQDASGNTLTYSVGEIFTKVVRGELILTHFITREGKTVSELPRLSPDRPSTTETTHAQRNQTTSSDLKTTTEELKSPQVSLPPRPLHEDPLPTAPQQARRLPTGPLREVNVNLSPPLPKIAENEDRVLSRSVPGSAPTVKASPSIPKLSTRELTLRETTALRALLEARVTTSKWTRALLEQGAQRHPSSLGDQNLFLANVLRASVDPSRPEGNTEIGRGLINLLSLAEVSSRLSSIFSSEQRNLRALRNFALEARPTPPKSDDIKIVSGGTVKSPAQLLAQLQREDLAPAVREGILRNSIPQAISSWRADKQSAEDGGEHESSPRILRQLFALADTMRKDPLVIRDTRTRRALDSKYQDLERKLPRTTPPKKPQL